jgi:hypothetical protein
VASSIDRGFRSVVAALCEAGATADGAETIARVLLDCGLSPKEAREWLTHHDLAYPHPQSPREYGGVPVFLVAGSVWCLRQGREDIVLNGARAYGGSCGMACSIRVGE